MAVGYTEKKENKFLTNRANAYSVPRLDIKGMRKLLEKYYNINYYCTYKLEKPNKFDPFGQTKSAHLIYHMFP